MSTLPTLHAAFLAAGKSKAQIARLSGVNPETLRTYFTGSQIVPEHRRARMQEAFGALIDWPQYCADFRAAKIAREAENSPSERIAAKSAPTPPKVAPRPPAPAPRPTAPIMVPKAKAPAKPAPSPAAADAAPARKVSGRLFGIIPIYDDEAEA